MEEKGPIRPAPFPKIDRILFFKRIDIFLKSRYNS